MINRFDIEERVREWGLREDVVEKDYVLGWILAGIGLDPILSKAWAFKGGTCLKKCYLETYRFSEDLDFTVLLGGPVKGGDLTPIVDAMLLRVNEASGIQFSDQAPLFKTNPTATYTEGRIYYRGPRNAPKVATVKLDLSASEKLVRPTVQRQIAHAYPDALPKPATVQCYSFDEVFAEKIRAMGERSRPRDLYDIINLFRRPELHGKATELRQVLNEKCVSKGVPVPNMASLETSKFRGELESGWKDMLAHQLPELPPFQDFWAELPGLFAWLEGEPQAPPLPVVEVKEAIQPAWQTPATVATWGFGVSVESLRFAASNHLCVELGYNGSTRIVEPYAFRKSRPGHLLFCAVKVENGETRNYRVDRIQSIRVTQRSFRPRYVIEAGTMNGFTAPPLRRKNSQW